MSDKHQTASVGRSLDDFLHEQGLYDSADQEAIKRVLSFQAVKSHERAEAGEKCAGQSDGHQSLRAGSTTGPYQLFSDAGDVEKGRT